jgi:hypothetical protein
MPSRVVAVDTVLLEVMPIQRPSHLVMEVQAYPLPGCHMLVAVVVADRSTQAILAPQETEQAVAEMEVQRQLALTQPRLDRVVEAVDDLLVESDNPAATARMDWSS